MRETRHNESVSSGRYWSSKTSLLQICKYYLLTLIPLQGLIVAIYMPFGWERIRFEMVIGFALSAAVGLPILALLVYRQAQLQQKIRQLTTLASIDRMTGLLNRMSFLELLDERLTQGKVPGQGVFIYIDADGFKQINDQFGHTVGDEVIKHIASQLKRKCRNIDLISRLGGEEFAIFVPDISGQAGAAFAERLRRTIYLEGDVFGIPSLKVSVSIGLAKVKPGDTTTTLMSRADRSMYEAKNAGRNAVVVDIDRYRIA